MPYNVATFDFESKSAAGFRWCDVTKKWKGLKGAPQGKKGLGTVGANNYARHPTTRVLTLSYQLPGGPKRRWRPGLPLPQDLFDWLAAGGHIEAHNVMFERLIWTFVCMPRYGFPPLPPEQLHCSMATARVNALPGSLEKLGDVLQLSVRKNADGRRLLNKFSIPRNPTKADPRLWIEPEEDPDDAERLYVYCDDDVATEQAASARMKPMTDMEREFWLVDQEINWRGIAVDRPAIRDCIVILEQALEQYGAECRAITGGLEPSQVQALVGWLAAQGVTLYSLDADNVEAALARVNLPPVARRVLEIRALVGSASVKKLYAMEIMACPDDRLRDLIVHHGARTGRPTGEGPQPLNLPKAGPPLVVCAHCGRPHKPAHDACPWCGAAAALGRSGKWKAEYVPHVLEIMALRSLALVEFFFGDALLCISGCIRGLFVAGPGKVLIASDYSAIEAVVIAMLAGEEWRIQVFRDQIDVYIASIAKALNKPIEEYFAYKEEHGDHHPDRATGKILELALGFAGWINAIYAMQTQTGINLEKNEYELKQLILAWREASPSIVELWGGQWRGAPWDGYAERYGIEGAAVNAIQYPGHAFAVRGITFQMRDDALIVTLPSTRELTYHSPRLEPSQRDYAAPGELSITYMTWNSNPKYGPMGWVRMSTFGGRLTENSVQAVAHDILRYAILNLRAAGYPTVLSVYDEIVIELDELPFPLPAGVVDPRIADVERIMMIMPPWAEGWPIRAAGGWSNVRYRKG